MMRTITHRLASVGLAVTGVLTFVAVASAAQNTVYGGTTSQKQGGSALRLTLAVGHGAVSNVQVAALVTRGATTCAVNISSTSFAFSKGKAKITRSHKFGGKLTDGHGDSMTITGLAKSGFPISFRVSANGKAVDSLVLHYEVTTCGGSPGNSPPAYRFNALAIKSGSFSGSATGRFGPGDFVLLRISGTFFGRVATGKVTATQHLRSFPTCTETEDFTANAK